MNLTQLPLHTPAVVDALRGLDGPVAQQDGISRRLLELGFARGEPVRVVARGPFGADPLLVQIGHTRFALRRTEAQRVTVQTSS